jgi:hypothetical protein
VIEDLQDELLAAREEIRSLRGILAAAIKAHGGPLGFYDADLKNNARVRLSMSKDEARGRVFLHAATT